MSGAGQSVAGQSFAGQAAVGQAAVGQYFVGQSVAGQSFAGQAAVGQAAVDQLLELLDLKSLGGERFLGMSPGVGLPRLFGGQVAGQALVAAGRTVAPDRPVHSLHGYFVRPGDCTAPVEFAVENIRDGNSFSARRSVAVQHGKPIFLMSASFQVPEDGLEHQAPAPADVPGPDESTTMTEQLARYPDRLRFWNGLPRPVDVRYVGESGWVAPGDRPAAPRQRVWLRVDGKLPDDPLLHAGALTYASDLPLLDAVLSVHGEVWGPGGVVGASLDHTLWFHRPFRADEWFLYDCVSPSTFGARGLAIGRMLTLEGRHIATAAQEGLLRQTGD